MLRQDLSETHRGRLVEIAALGDAQHRTFGLPVRRKAFANNEWKFGHRRIGRFLDGVGGFRVASGAITVAKAPSTLKAKLKKVRVRRGKHDSVKVTVSAPGLVPTGTVTIKSGGKVVGRGVLAGGRVRIALRTKLTVGRHKLTARFAGDPWVQGSKDAVHLVISRGARR